MTRPSLAARVISAIGAAVFLLGAAWLNTASAAYPEKPVTLVVGFSAGGGTDFMARLLAKSLSQRWGQPVVVENKSGAEGMIAEQYVAQSAPDGYTLAYVINTHSVIPLLRKLDFDPIEDLAPVSLVEAHADALVVSPSLPASTLQEFIELAKSTPGVINFGSGGTGTPPFLIMALFMSKTGTEMTNISYQGSSASTMALLGGEIQAVWASVENVAEQINTGSLKALAVSTNVRSPVLPDVPTVAEVLSEPDFDERVWQGVVAPAGTPKVIIDQIHADIVEVLKLTEVKDAFETRGFSAIGSSPGEFDEFIRDDNAKWAKLLKEIAAP